VTEAADQVKRRFGERSIVRARLLGRGLPAPFERDPSSPLARRGLPEGGPEPDEADGGGDGTAADESPADEPSP